MFPLIIAHPNGPRGHRPRTTGILLVGFSLALAAGCSNFAAQSKNAQGVQLYQQGQYQAALREFQEATYTDPGNPDGYYNLAATYHRLGVIEKQQSYLDQAENYYNQCLDHHPDHRECYRGLAVLLAEQDRKEEAFRLAEGWIERRPDSADARIELARLLEEFGDRSQAKEKLTEALTIEPNNPRALAALGKIREDMGEQAEALRNYQRSLSYDRFQPQLASRVASLRATLGGGSSTTSPDSRTRLVDRQAAPLR
ncbi:MAG: hypothetical protein A2V70_12110 [Planctomycetes bacterium RBG_13_63_9]|nr:MAG: hypothetical protein A2V70_12110 [Planctomycetes bacterium RBG_13_63_9]